MEEDVKPEVIDLTSSDEEVDAPQPTNNNISLLKLVPAVEEVPRRHDAPQDERVNLLVNTVLISVMKCIHKHVDGNTPEDVLVPAIRRNLEQDGIFAMFRGVNMFGFRAAASEPLPVPRSPSTQHGLGNTSRKRKFFSLDDENDDDDDDDVQHSRPTPQKTRRAQHLSSDSTGQTITLSPLVLERFGVNLSVFNMKSDEYAGPPIPYKVMARIEQMFAHWKEDQVVDLALSPPAGNWHGLIHCAFCRATHKSRCLELNNITQACLACQDAKLPCFSYTKLKGDKLVVHPRPKAMVKGRHWRDWEYWMQS